MWEIVHHFVDKAEIFGWQGAVGSAAAIVIALTMYDLGKKINNMIVKRFSKAHKAKPLSSITFTKIDTMISYRISRMKVACPLRKCIFTKMLEIQLSSMKMVLTETASAKVDHMHRDEFQNFWISSIDRCFSTLEDKCKVAKLPPIALEKFVSMNENNEELIKILTYLICDSDSVYDSNSEKSLAIIDCIGAILDTFLITAERSIASINGKLSLVSFEGFTCMECSDDCPLRASLHKFTMKMSETVILEKIRANTIDNSKS